MLTDPRPNTAGAVWFNEPFDLSVGFVTSFSFTIRGVNSASEDGGVSFLFVGQREVHLFLVESSLVAATLDLMAHLR